MPLTSPRRWLEAVGVVILFTLLTIPMYAPISLNMGSAILDQWDGFLHTWILAWDVHKLTAGLGGLWDANIFWPHPDTLAYSDHLLASSLLAAPFLLLTSNPILAHNAVTYLSFVLGGLGMFLLARRLTGSPFAAVVAGIIYVYCPWRFGQLGHESQLLTTQWLPFSLLFLHRVLQGTNRNVCPPIGQCPEKARWRDALLFGLFFALHSLSSYYLAAMGATAVITVIAVYLVRARGRFSKAVWIRLIAAGILAGLLISPAVVPYYRVSRAQGLEWDIKSVEQLSADPFDYFRAPPWNRLWGKVTTHFENRYNPACGENHLFLGLTVLSLALFGLFGFKPREWTVEQKAYLWVAIVAFVLSLGPYLHLAWRRLPIPLPYYAVYHLVPGFQGLRVPARFGMLVETGLAILAAYGFLRLLRRIRSKPKKAIWSIAIIAALFAEFYSSPLRHFKVPTGDKIPEVYKWLASQPNDFVIAEFPQLPSLSWLPEEKRLEEDPLGFRYMYYSTYHWKKLVNGRSGFIPPTSAHITEALMRFPSRETVNMLRYLGVKYVLLHTDSYKWEDNFNAAEYARQVGGFVPEVERFGADIVYEVPDPTGEKRRRKWDNIEIKEIVVPKGVRPGSMFNLEIYLQTVDYMPAYSFELVDFEAAARIRGLEGSSRQVRNKRDFIMIDPQGQQRISFTFNAPETAGSFKWNVEFTIRGMDEFTKEIGFEQNVGDYPDSSAPDILKAKFLNLEVPKSVKANSMLEIKGTVRNEGNTFWRAHRFDKQDDGRGLVMFGLHEWRDVNGVIPPLKAEPYCHWEYLESSVPPGGETAVRLTARAPEVPGTYEIVINMIDAEVALFEHAGGQSAITRIEVTAE